MLRAVAEPQTLLRCASSYVADPSAAVLVNASHTLSVADFNGTYTLDTYINCAAACSLTLPAFATGCHISIIASDRSHAARRIWPDFNGIASGATIAQDRSYMLTSHGSAAWSVIGSD